MENFTKEILKTTCGTERGNITTKMETFMKAIGLMIKESVEVDFILVMAQNRTEYLLRIKLKVR